MNDPELDNDLLGRVVPDKSKLPNLTGVLLRLLETQSDYQTFITEEVEKLRTLSPENFQLLIDTLEINTSLGLIFLAGQLEGLTEIEQGFRIKPENLDLEPTDLPDIQRAKIALRVAQDLLTRLKS